MPEGMVWPLIIAGINSAIGKDPARPVLELADNRRRTPQRAEVVALLRLSLDSWVSPRRSRLSEVVTRPTVSGDTALLFGTQDTPADSLQETSPRRALSI